MARIVNADTAGQIAEKQKRQRQRNWALAIALVAFVALVYAVTIVKIRGGG
jgi:thiol:disulfide interchange protein